MIANDDPSLIDDDAHIPPDHPARIAVARLLSNTLSIWCLCDATACRRAGRCKGDPRKCLNECTPLLSPDVVAGGQAVIEGCCQELTFDEAYARWPAELTALSAWIDRIEGPPPQPPSA
jgi:hypothetical protein